MNIYCVVTIDTECDRGSKWCNLPSPMQFSGVTDLIPNVFQKIFSKHGVKPTYLVSPEVLQDKDATATLKSLSHVELGSHLHCEFVEPLKSPSGHRGDFQAMYPPDIEAAKLANLTKLFEESIGYKPTSFRAGRWGISPHSFKILEDLGYLVDSSVTPYFRWEFPNYVLDYKTASDKPYFPSITDFLKEGQMRLLQVPVTIYSAYGSMVNKSTANLPPFLKNALLKLPLWRPVWLRPTYSNFAQMKYAIDGHIASHADEADIVLNMMFHNVEILPNANPYDLNKEQIALFLDNIERVFDYLNSRGTKFLGLTDVYPMMEKKRAS